MTDRSQIAEALNLPDAEAATEELNLLSFQPPGLTMMAQSPDMNELLSMTQYCLPVVVIGNPEEDNNEESDQTTGIEDATGCNTKYGESTTGNTAFNTVPVNDNTTTDTEYGSDTNSNTTVSGNISSANLRPLIGSFDPDTNKEASVLFRNPWEIATGNIDKEPVGNNIDIDFAPVEENDTTQEESSLQRWGRREFSVNQDGSANYEFKRGDTLWEVSKDILSSRLGHEPSSTEIWREIVRLADANSISNAYLIQPGQKINIPPYESDGSETHDSPADTYRFRQPPLADGAFFGDNQPPGDTNRSLQNRRDRSQWYKDQSGDTRLGRGGYFGCGPTSLLMALADWGLMEPTETNRINLMRDTGTLAQGQFPGNVVTMADHARRRGLEAQAIQRAPDLEGMDQVLASGRSLIVNGTLGNTPHFVYIAGRDARGNYVLGDPANSNRTSWTRQELLNFVSGRRNPPGYVSLRRP